MELTVSDVVLCNARLLRKEGLFDVTIREGTIHTVEPAVTRPRNTSPITMVSVGMERAKAWDLEGRLLLPGFVDIHTHLDKALTLPFTENPDGTLDGAIAGYNRYESVLTSEDVYRRTLITAQWALTHGTTTIRTHINYGVDGQLFELSLEGLKEASKVLNGFIDLQIVVMCPFTVQPALASILERGVADDLVAIGGAPHLSSEPRKNMEWVVELAKQFGLTVDVHVDEQLNPSVRTLQDLVELIGGWDSPKPVVAGHCVSLDVMPMADTRNLVRRVAENGIGVVTLPGSNLFLQGRHDEIGVRRGLTRVKMLLEAGVLVAAASDNIQDVFHPYGRGDLLEAALLTAYAAHLRPEDAETALIMISEVPGRLAVHPEYGVKPTQIADLVVLDTRDALCALQTMSPGRWVFKGGRCVAVRQTTTKVAKGFPCQPDNSQCHVPDAL